MNDSTALFTDRYEFTMVDAALAEGIGERECVFEVFTRRLHAGRRYGVFAGTGRLLEAVENFRFTESDLDYLTSECDLANSTIEFLANYRFGGTIRAYREGELFFPNSPVLEVQGTFAEAVVLETLILSILNYDSAVATAASRMVSAAEGKPIIEMGSRRTNESSAVAAARAAFIAGFSATSNLAAGKKWGVPTRGTAAHSFTLLHETEEDAFRAQVQRFGPDTTLLIDTFDTLAAVERAVEVAGTKLGAVRIDSGDLPSMVSEVRNRLDRLGATETKIVVTNDLNENSIAALRGSPVDVFGVGTAVVTGSGAPAAGMVYKLVEHQDAAGEWLSVAKRSTGKTNHPGRKRAFREIRNGQAAREVIDSKPFEGENSKGRELLTTIYEAGSPDKSAMGVAGTEAARKHHQTVLAELPEAGRRLSPGDPAIPTAFV